MLWHQLISLQILFCNCVTVIDSIESTKKIVALSGLRWKIVSKPTPSARESVENRDVYKRLISAFFAFINI